MYVNSHSKYCHWIGLTHWSAWKAEGFPSAETMQTLITDLLLTKVSNQSVLVWHYEHIYLLELLLKYILSIALWTSEKIMNVDVVICSPPEIFINRLRARWSGPEIIVVCFYQITICNTYCIWYFCSVGSWMVRCCKASLHWVYGCLDNRLHPKLFGSLHAHLVYTCLQDVVGLASWIIIR